MTAGEAAASLGDLLRRYKGRTRITTPELAAQLGSTSAV